jgi:hypothetical protein
MRRPKWAEVDTKAPPECRLKAGGAAARAQLFNFQWLARSDAGSLFLLFTYGSRRRLFIDQSFL